MGIVVFPVFLEKCSDSPVWANVNFLVPPPLFTVYGHCLKMSIFRYNTQKQISFWKCPSIYISRLSFLATDLIKLNILKCWSGQSDILIYFFKAEKLCQRLIEETACQNLVVVSCTFMSSIYFALTPHIRLYLVPDFLTSVAAPFPPIL